MKRLATLALIALPLTAPAQTPADLVIAGRADVSGLDLFSAFNGERINRIATDIVPSCWDVKMLSDRRTALVATGNGLLMRINIDTGKRVAADIPLGDSSVNSGDNRKLTLINNEYALLWIRRIGKGYLYNLKTGKLTRTYLSGSVQLDGLVRSGNYLYGVDSNGYIRVWSFNRGGTYVATSALSTGRSGGYMSQPVSGRDGWIYALHGSGPTWLGRFKPSYPNPTEWDPNFEIPTRGWAHANYLTWVGPSSLVCVTLDYGGGMHHGYGRFDLRWRTFYASGPGYAFDSLHGFNYSP